MTLALDATIPSFLYGSVPPEDQKRFDNLVGKDAPWQDVKDLPTVPGRGESYFKVFLLVLGQRT